MAAAAAAGARKKARPGKFADMVVHRLPGEFHSPGDARGGIRLEEGSENLQSKWMVKQDGSLGRLADEVKFRAS
jgi:hypothetical protein